MDERDIEVAGKFETPTSTTSEPAAAPKAWPGRLGSRRLAAIGTLAAVLLVGGIGVAFAQTDGSSTTTPAPATTVPGARPTGDGGPGVRGGGPGGPGKMGGPRGAIHGEFVTPNGSGGYQTIATQTGEVTAVSNSSISVKSADGFSRTYSVDDNTMVNAGRDGIEDVKNGNTVRIDAVVTDGKAAARSIHNTTELDRIRQHWNPNAPAAPNPAA